jgi:hypothetical protein
MLQSPPPAVAAPSPVPVLSSSAGPAASPSSGPAQYPPVIVPTNPCVQVTSQLAAISFNPNKPIAVTQFQPFIVALRVTAGIGYYWNLRNPESEVQPPPPQVARSLGMQSVPDTALSNPTDTPGVLPRVGGLATDLFLFTADNGGRTQLTFDLYTPGRNTPAASKTFTVDVGPRQMVCV